MRISGPIGVRVVEYRGLSYHLFCDRHNSRHGECPDCNDPNTCKPFSLFIEEVLASSNKKQRNIHFYLESPFVLVDSTPSTIPDISSLDMIDSLQVQFRATLRRSKSESPFMPFGKVHFVDVRDVYEIPYGSDGLRHSLSANPLSGSWMKRRMDYAVNSNNKATIRDAISVVTIHMQFILDNSERIFLSFISERFDPPVCRRNDDAATDFNDRVSRMRKMTSNGIHRVFKQVKKLKSINSKVATSIVTWALESFKRERAIADTKFKEWRQKIEWFVESNDYSIFDSVEQFPVMIPIVMGSLVMDVYFLARSFYHKGDVYMFGGAAHIGNYLNFFERNEGKIVFASDGEWQSERCVRYC